MKLYINKINPIFKALKSVVFITVITTNLTPNLNYLKKSQKKCTPISYCTVQVIIMYNFEL